MDSPLYHISIEALPMTPGFAAYWDEIAWQKVYPQVFRIAFDKPGLALLSFQEEISSKTLRGLMWALKNTLSQIHEQATGKHLAYLSMGRFDAQVTTKFHLDGAPDEAFLMLGYEASPVQSQLSIADYSRAAHDWGITPRKLLDDYNPMYADNEKRLRPYITKLAAFNPRQSHILLLNNSALPYDPNARNLLGVMHQATVVPDATARRIINSTMMTTATTLNDEPIDAATQQTFLKTDEVIGAS